jgi:hypothetical protein
MTIKLPTVVHPRRIAPKPRSGPTIQLDIELDCRGNGGRLAGLPGCCRPVGIHTLGLTPFSAQVLRAELRGGSPGEANPLRGRAACGGIPADDRKFRRESPVKSGPLSGRQAIRTGNPGENPPTSRKRNGNRYSPRSGSSPGPSSGISWGAKALPSCSHHTPRARAIRRAGAVNSFAATTGITSAPSA